MQTAARSQTKGQAPDSHRAQGCYATCKFPGLQARPGDVRVCRNNGILLSVTLNISREISGEKLVVGTINSNSLRTALGVPDY